MTVTLHHGDCFKITDDIIQDGTAALAFVDPPYNIGIFKKMDPGAYLEWCEQWIELCSRKLKANGAFWVSHSKPDVLVDISRMIERRGRKRINWVTWDKYADAGELQGFMDGYTIMGDLRSFQVMAEYLIYHADEGQWTTQCDKERGFIFEPLRAYLDGEKDRAGISNSLINAAWCEWRNVNSTSQTQKWFSNSCFNPPTREAYFWLRELFYNYNHGGEYLRREYEDLRREYEDLRREYEDLRREYEDLRYTFNNPGKVSSVWQFPPAARNGHPTPKPLGLLRRIVETTTNPGDLVFDPMAGSGQMALVCLDTGRDFTGCEIERKWYELGQGRIERAQTEPEQLSF